MFNVGVFTRTKALTVIILPLSNVLSQQLLLRLKSSSTKHSICIPNAFSNPVSAMEADTGLQGRQLRVRSLLPGQLQEALHSIGIWFKKTSKQTVVWVANRERPVLEPSASRFALSDRGELVLLATPSNTLLWSSNATSPSPRTTAAPATL